MVPGTYKGILNRCYNLESFVFQLSDELVPMDSLTRVGGRFPNLFLSNHTPSAQHAAPPPSHFSNQHLYSCFLLPVLFGYCTPVRVRLLTCLCSDSVLCL